MNEQYLTSASLLATLCAFERAIRMSANTLASLGNGTPDPTTQAIRDVLNASMAAWNGGDLPGFLCCYDDSPLTSYLGADRIVTGFDAIAAMYALRFDTVSPAARGMLSLSLTRVTRLCDDHALAIGRYFLRREETYGGSGDGVFSLVLRQTLLGWRIIADHTTAA